MLFRSEIILQDTKEDRQTVLFSATMSPEILQITKKYQKNPESVKSIHQQLTVPSIEQAYYEVQPSRKAEALCRLLDIHDLKL